jgi:hypothetical protein
MPTPGLMDFEGGFAEGANSKAAEVVLAAVADLVGVADTAAVLAGVAGWAAAVLAVADMAEAVAAGIAEHPSSTNLSASADHWS